MINLLPKEEKKALIKDFYLRFLTVFFIAFGFSVIIASVFLLPSYFSSISQKNLVESKIQSQKNSPAPENEEGNSLIINDLNKKLDIIELSSTNKFSPSESIISQIIKSKIQGIRISKIYFSSNSLDEQITIDGTAPSRENLLLFRLKLEANPSFKKVDLPISNFIKGSDIQFSLTLFPV